MNIFMILETHRQIAFQKKLIAIYNATSNIEKCPSRNILTGIWHHTVFRLENFVDKNVVPHFNIHFLDFIFKATYSSITSNF